MSEKLWSLKKCELFQILTLEEISTLELASRLRTFDARRPVYLPADHSDAVFLLTSGRAKVCHLTDDGKQSILGLIEPGELFGELALFEDGDREEYVETMERSSLLAIPGDHIRQLMRTHPDIAMGVTKLIGMRRQRIERRLKHVMFLSNRERLIHLMLDLAEQYGALRGPAVELRVRLSHQEIAGIVGSTRETVTVELGKIQNDGLIRLSRKRVTILDPMRMAELVGRRFKTPEMDTLNPGRASTAFSI